MTTDKRPNKSIRRHILQVLFGVMILTTLAFGTVSVREIWYLGQQAKFANIKQGEDAVQISKAALETLSKDSLLQIVKDQSILCDARLERVRARNEALAAHAALLWRQSQTSVAPVSSRSSALHYAPGVSPTTTGADAVFCQSVRPFLHWTQASDNYIESVQVATTQGVFVRDPDAREASSSYNLGALTPFPSVSKSPSIIPPGYDPRRQPWYKQAAKAGKSGWTELFISPFTGRLSVACYTPVFDTNQQRVAIVTAIVSLEMLNTHILRSRLEGKGEALLIDARFNTVAGEGIRIRNVQQKELVSEKFVVKASNEVQSRLVQDVAAKKAGLVEGSYEGKEHLIAYAPVNSTSWTVVMLLPTADVVAPMVATEQALLAKTKATQQQIEQHVIASFLILFVVFVLLGVIVSVLEMRVTGRLVAPILALDKSAQILGQGNLDHRLEVHTGDELQDLADTFNQMASSLKTHMAQLAETTAARERLKSELALASEIQRALLPCLFPAFPNRREFDLFALMEPAKEVGGDFYDFFFVDETHLCFLIADVSDKGVPAALYMMVAKTMLKTEGLRGLPPDQILSHVNNLLSPENDNCMFVTALCAILNTVTGEVQISNAGHNPPILSNSMGTRFVPMPPGFVLGPMPDSPYQTISLMLEQGDTLLFYTDGVTEAKNSDSQLFGNQRLIDCVQVSIEEDVSTTVHRVRETIKDFVLVAPQFDDITMLGLKFLVEPEVDMSMARSKEAI